VQRIPGALGEGVLRPPEVHRLVVVPVLGGVVRFVVVVVVNVEVFRILGRILQGHVVGPAAEPEPGLRTGRVVDPLPGKER